MAHAVHNAGFFSFRGNLSAADENRIKELAIEAILEQPEVIEEAITRLRQIQEQRLQQAVVQKLPIAVMILNAIPTPRSWVMFTVM